MALTIQQQNAVNAITNTKRDIIVRACAGTGKTFTLMEMLNVIQNRAYLGAFNKSIAMELGDKIAKKGFDRSRIFSGTLHSAGMSAWRKLYPDVKVDSNKVWDILEMIRKPLPESHPMKEMGYFTTALVSLAKQKAIGFLSPIESRKEWYDIIEHFDLEDMLVDHPVASMEEQVEIGIDFAIQMYKKSIELNKKVIDFDDMLLAPLVGNARMYTYDFVMVDEAQDTNSARRALAIKMLKPGTGRLIAVGDPKQAIYGFTGADSDSMDLIKEARNAIEIPLTVTFRCAKNIVRLAQTWVPDIEAHESNPDGVVRTVPLHGYDKINAETGEKEFVPGFWNETITPEDGILCRNTRALVEVAYGFLRRGIACRVAGREIGEGLVSLANRWRIKDLNVLIEKLKDYKESEMQKWQAKGRESMAMTVEDKVETLLILIDRMKDEGKHTVKDLVEFIKSLFGDPKEGEKKVITLMTGHRSKGLEWKRVYWLMPELCPSKWAIKPWQQEQEQNLQYVIVTRAMEELIMVRGK